MDMCLNIYESKEVKVINVKGEQLAYYISAEDRSQFALRKCSHSFTSISDPVHIHDAFDLHRSMFALRKCPFV